MSRKRPVKAVREEIERDLAQACYYAMEQARDEGLRQEEVRIAVEEAAVNWEPRPREAP